MSQALYALQHDLIRNGKRLDLARKLVEDLIVDIETNRMPRDRYNQIITLQKVLASTGAYREKLNPPEGMLK